MINYFLEAVLITLYIELYIRIWGSRSVGTVDVNVNMYMNTNRNLRNEHNRAPLKLTVQLSSLVKVSCQTFPYSDYPKIFYPLFNT